MAKARTGRVVKAPAAEVPSSKALRREPSTGGKAVMGARRFAAMRKIPRTSRALPVVLRCDKVLTMEVLLTMGSETTNQLFGRMQKD